MQDFEVFGSRCRSLLLKAGDNRLKAILYVIFGVDGLSLLHTVYEHRPCGSEEHSNHRFRLKLIASDDGSWWLSWCHPRRIWLLSMRSDMTLILAGVAAVIGLPVTCFVFKVLCTVFETLYSSANCNIWWSSIHIRNFEFIEYFRWRLAHFMTNQNVRPIHVFFHFCVFAFLVVCSNDHKNWTNNPNP